MPTEILLITEAKASDTKSFYKCNTPLYRSVKSAFEMQFGNFETDIDFLAFFKEMKCKIEYLVTEVIDRKDKKIRQKQRSESVDSLSKRLRIYRPKCIIIIMKDIENFVLMAVERANLPEDLFIKSVPFPAMSEKNRINCELGIAKILKDYVVGH
ncbi:MAG: hypothetical protein GXO46_03550 [Chlorobi bacterium]|jgi:hypothetical protein|uniref:Uncharacterized protein n=3 Tax=Chryseobacterium TaxID=59732 RepID=A0AAJ1R448_9FLAO|nr:MULTISPECIES: hypothetical protein [Flavobacteriales]NPA08043.1 hypothetical protein [Chlorobiota bacterium]MBF6645674.1 hypothetical protein [Chryseobacterium indologenes]MBU3049844.1 hypothetical protein [Chryseobacterium indologenes]MDN4011333.1 hypothetical protein [Chryseobacterium gambrini]NML59270.1 hypothetical protein [Chryseobacterium cheonjiense]